MSKKPDPTPWRAVHGILLLDKPAGLSSNQALQQAKRLFRAEKAGHTGSLDPLATGLLPLCFGEATKIAGLLLGNSKAYDAELMLGVTTDTGDAEGQVLRRRPVPALDTAQIERALAPLRGRITQVPPVYSAIKQGGEPLYAKARRGEAVQAPARTVEVFALELTRWEGDRLALHVECSSGTYIRSLVVDLGEALGCGAHLTALRRVWVTPFRHPQLHRLADLADAAADPARLDALLLPLEAGLGDLPVLTLDAGQAQRLRQGQRLTLAEVPAPGLYVARGPLHRVLALVDVHASGELRVRRGFNASV
ncbi:MAG TPA: tRNA pseudouridine(55) synthase TruB [Rhodanobacteraceae bacterium]|nr:tRNA pseudouridine(55) synthase TruB [Rhodanobacteraceae bacterium]